MAVFGVQVVLSMIVASFLHKVSPYFSVGRRLILYRLRRYQTPSDTLLRPHVSVPHSGGRGGGGDHSNHGGRKRVSNQRTASSTTTTDVTIAHLPELKKLSSIMLDPSLAVPKSANIKLHDVQLRSSDLIILPFSEQLEWMIDLAVAAVVVCTITMAYYYLFPSAVQTEYNLSTIWLLLVCGYIIHVLARLTKFYFSDELASQRSQGIVFTMFFFVCSLGILLIDEGVLDFGLEKTHKDISLSIERLIGNVRNQTYEESDGDNILPVWAFKIFLAVCATLLSVVLIFPGFRFADIHFSTIKYSASKRSFLRTVLHICYIAPMFCLSLWIRPLSHDVIANRNHVNLFGLMEMSYENFRFGIISSICLLRVIMYSTYMQGYLDTAKWRVTNMRHEQGRITIKDLRDRVSSIFTYYPGTGIHYLAPFLVLLLLTLLLHTSSVSLATLPSGSSSADQANSGSMNVFKFSGFGISVFHGCISFLIWWLCFTNAITSGIGPIVRECII